MYLVTSYVPLAGHPDDTLDLETHARFCVEHTLHVLLLFLKEDNMTRSLLGPSSCSLPLFWEGGFPFLIFTVGDTVVAFKYIKNVTFKTSNIELKLEK